MSKIELIRADWNWDDDFPMSQIVKAGDYLWLSGQIAYDMEGNLVGEGDLKAQANQIFTNMTHVLSRVGCDLTSVVHLTAYFAVPMTGFEVARDYWEVRNKFFGDHKCASVGMQVAALVTPEILLEVSAVAYAPDAVVPND